MTWIDGSGKIRCDATRAERRRNRLRKTAVRQAQLHNLQLRQVLSLKGRNEEHGYTFPYNTQASIFNPGSPLIDEHQCGLVLDYLVGNDDLDVDICSAISACETVEAACPGEALEAGGTLLASVHERNKAVRFEEASETRDLQQTSAHEISKLETVGPGEVVDGGGTEMTYDCYWEDLARYQECEEESETQPDVHAIPGEDREAGGLQLTSVHEISKEDAASPGEAQEAGGTLRTSVHERIKAVRFKEDSETGSHLQTSAHEISKKQGAVGPGEAVDCSAKEEDEYYWEDLARYQEIVHEIGREEAACPGEALEAGGTLRTSVHKKMVSGSQIGLDKEPEQQSIGNASSSLIGAKKGNEIEVKIIDQYCSEGTFRIRRTTKLSKLTESFARCIGLPVTQVMLFFHGERVHPDETPGELGLQNDDVILAHVNW